MDDKLLADSIHMCIEDDTQTIMSKMTQFFNVLQEYKSKQEYQLDTHLQATEYNNISKCTEICLKQIFDYVSSKLTENPMFTVAIIKKTVSTLEFILLQNLLTENAFNSITVNFLHILLNRINVNASQKQVFEFSIIRTILIEFNKLEAVLYPLNSIIQEKLQEICNFMLTSADSNGNDNSLNVEILTELIWNFKENLSLLLHKKTILEMLRVKRLTFFSIRETLLLIKCKVPNFVVCLIEVCILHIDHINLFLLHSEK